MNISKAIDAATRKASSTAPTDAEVEAMADANRRLLTALVYMVESFPMTENRLFSQRMAIKRAEEAIVMARVALQREENGDEARG